MKGKGKGQAGNISGNTGGNAAENTDGKLASDKKKLGEKLTPEQKKDLVKRFDKDGDGKLNAEERDAAKQALKKDGKEADDK
jgi:Ca2+-binding EF-hand superfamily protein